MDDETKTNQLPEINDLRSVGLAALLLSEAAFAVIVERQLISAEGAKNFLLATSFQLEEAAKKSGRTLPGKVLTDVKDILMSFLDTLETKPPDPSPD